MRKQFTNQEIADLAANPHTHSVTESTLIFKAEFKEILWSRYKAGERLADVLREHGYDPAVIGQKRIQNTIYSIRKSKQAGGKLTEGHSGKRVSRSVSSLEYELKYLRQENEFLKKLYQLETGKTFEDSK